MPRLTLRPLLVLLVAVPGCETAVSQLVPPTPLPSGVYRGTSTCDLRATDPSGAQTITQNTLTASFEINERGVPLVQGEEIRVGRTIVLQGIEMTYTRIQPTEDGIVIHGDISGAVNGVSFSGLSIATLRATPGGQIEYRVTTATTDTGGFASNTDCTFLLSR